MSKGDKVFYDGKTYTVIWVYESGFLELKGEFRIQLVHESKVTHID